MAITLAETNFEALSKEWTELLPRAYSDNVFLTPTWQNLWWTQFSKSGKLHLLAFRDREKLIGIAPLIEKNSSIYFLGDTDLFDYHDFIVDSKYLDDFYDKLSSYFTASPWSSIKLHSLGNESPTLKQLPGKICSMGWNSKIVLEDSVPGMNLPQNWDEHLAKLGKKHRHELKRKIRRLEDNGPYNVISSGDVNSSKVSIEEFLDLMKASKEEKSRFMTADREVFFREMVHVLSSEKTLNLYFLEVQDHIVASAICFDYNGSRFLYNSGYNPQFSHLSVGLILKAFTVRDAIESGFHYFDFLRGDEPYKYHLGGQESHISTLELSR